MTYTQAIKKFNYSGRKTLRTIFDYLSHEWNNTILSEKENILKDLIENQSLTYFLEEYIKLYSKELHNKEYVVFAIPKSLDIIYRKSEDSIFKEMLKKQYLDFYNNSEIGKEFELHTPLLIFDHEEY